MEIRPCIDGLEFCIAVPAQRQGLGSIFLMDAVDFVAVNLSVITFNDENQPVAETLKMAVESRQPQRSTQRKTIGLPLG